VLAGPSVLSNQDFLSRVEAVKADIRTLTTHVGQIASTHQRALSSPDAGSSAQLESMITQTQVLNTSIKDQIKFLETDAVRNKDNTVKNTQVGQLKSSFTKQLQEYRQEEVSYEKRYREQIARQYRIVNPEASDAEVREAADADWGNEGVFQTAVGHLSQRRLQWLYRGTSLVTDSAHCSPPYTSTSTSLQTTNILPAQDQPLRNRQHRTRRGARPPQ